MMTTLYRSRWFAPLFFTLLNVLLFLPSFTGGKLPVDSNPLYRSYPWRAQAGPGVLNERYHARDYHHVDQTMQLYPIRSEIRDQLREGRAPLWNDLVFCGAPLLGNPVATFGVTSVFHYFLGPRGYALAIIVQFILMGWFMFLLCEQLGLSRMASLAAGVAFMWNGYFFRWFGVISYLETLLWMPLLLYFAHRCFQQKDRFAFHGLVFAVLAQFLGEHSQNWLYNLVLLFLFSGWLLTKSSQRASSILKVCGAVLLGALLAMPDVLPFYSAFKNSPRSAEAAPLYEGRNHISPRKLVTLAIPDFYGRTDLNLFSRLLLKPEPEGQGSIWRRLVLGETGSVYNRLWVYIGLIPLVLALLGFCSKESTFWKIVGTAPLVFLTALNLDVVRRGIQWIWPAFDMLDHTRLLIFTIVSFCVLSAYGFDRLLSNAGSARRVARFSMWGAGILLVGIAALLLCATLFSSRIQAAGHSYFVGRTDLDNKSSFYEEGVNAIPGMFRESIPILVLPCLMLAALAAALSGSRARPGVILLLVVIDLLYHGRTDPPLYFSRPEILYPQNVASLEFLKDHLGDYRVVEIQSRRPFLEKPLTHYAELDLYRRRGNRYFDFDSFDFVARPDALMPYGIRSAGGYLSIYPRPFRELWNGRGNDTLQFVKPGETLDRWSGGWIDMQAIRYILAAPGMQSDVYPLAYRDGGLAIFENTKALPRWYFVDQQQVAADMLQAVKKPDFDPHRVAVVASAFPLPSSPVALESKIDVDENAPGSVTLATQTNKDAILVFSENYVPGWQCTIDGSLSQMIRTNHAFASVMVPAGRHRVHFEFRPAEFRDGLRIAVGALSLWMALAAIQLVKTRFSG